MTDATEIAELLPLSPAEVSGDVPLDHHRAPAGDNAVQDGAGGASPGGEAAPASTLHDLMEGLFPGKPDGCDRMNRTLHESYLLRIAYARAREVNDLDLGEPGSDDSSRKRQEFLFAALKPCLESLVPGDDLKDLIEDIGMYALDDQIDEGMNPDLEASSPRELMARMQRSTSEAPA